jgi:peptidoglycan/LPS O-acetylase OafA/YrhL
MPGISAAQGLEHHEATERGAAAAAPRSSFRPDVQGLRAFAVVVVVLDHLFGWPTGGFVGVDVFFVISGFLITGLLLREYEKTGRISFVGFYRRRVKRILPVAILVLVSTVAVAYVLFGRARFQSTVVDAVWALLFAANWRFAATGTDYFQSSGPVSPLQHYWSLAVEEQFYFVWPWLMLLLFVLFLRRGTRSGRRARLVTGIAITGLGAASFAWAMWQTADNATVAYFSTFTRGWELGVGAALAVAAPALARLPEWCRPVLAWIGLAGMTASLFLITSESAFPGPWAALPVLSTALVIAAGCGAVTHRTLAVLTNPVSRYIGDISYSMYLWHWPLIVFGGILLAEGSPLDQALLIAAIVLASVYSYHLVEDPIRRSAWLSGRRRDPAGAPVRSRPRRRRAARARMMSVWASLLVVVIAFVGAYQLDGHASTAPPEIDVAALPDAGGDSGEPLAAELSAQIADALAAEEWPELTPTMDEAIATGDTAEHIEPCGRVAFAYDEEACAFGDPEPEHVAVVVGDSTSMAYVQALHGALGDDGWQVRSYGTFGCSFMEPLIFNEDPAVVDACTDRKDAAVDAINDLQPDVVFITNTYDPRVPVDAEEPLTPEEWQQAMSDIVVRFEDSVGRIVFLAPPPNDVHIAVCYTPVAVPADCISHVTQQWTTYSQADAEVAEYLGAAYISSEPWFCVDGLCPSFVDGVPTKSDHVHMLPAYADKIAPVIRESLRSHGIIDF